MKSGEMKVSKTAKDDIVVTGHERALEVHVDGYKGLIIAGGVAKINYYSMYFDADGEKQHFVNNLRVTCSIETLFNISTALNKVIDDLREKGFLTVEEVPDEPV